MTSIGFTFDQSLARRSQKQVFINNQDPEILTLALTVSCLLHLLIFILTYFNFSGLFGASDYIKNITPPVLAVDLMANFATPKKQIVSESEKVNQIKPKDTHQEAEQNNSILEETVRRGDGGTPTNEVSKQMTSPPPINKPTPQKIVNPEKPKEITKDLAMLGAKSIPENIPSKNSSATENKFDLQTKTQNNLDAALAGNLFPGQGGSPDLLPNVREGEITLLNTKASKYAVFVRRVALQVFNDLKNRAWKQLNYQEIQSILSNSTVIAKLDPQGNLTSAKLVSDSGSKIFNDLIYSAVKEKARDPHPPESALVAGEFHFVFQTKMTSSLLPNSRAGGYGEKRWLVLSVGLE